ncbi:hypothetical protein PN465_01500 [Nodularia spumigena CS-584]|nr:hypothetical protein [Nodularia spumigena CS-584]
MHDNICYYFDRLFAVEPVPYDINIVLQSDFKKLINSSNKFKDYLKDIAEKYIALPTGEKDLVKKAYSNHLNIENLCNDAAIEVVKYTEIVNEDFQKLLKEFLTWLWDDYDSLPKALRNEYKDIQDHFNEFKKVQKGKVCPFCGVSSLKPKTNRKRRNAYDHYIPKAMYPFISINFKNLFPACHECNSDEKKEYDTPFNNYVRQKLIFPFDETYTIDAISINIDPEEEFNVFNFGTLLSDIDWNISFTLNSGTIDVYDAWDNIFKIKIRYKEYIQEYEETWFTDFVLRKFNEEVVSKKSTFQQYKDDLINDSKKLMIKDSLAILKFIYFTFIFSIPGIEEKLKQVVSSKQ